MSLLIRSILLSLHTLKILKFSPHFKMGQWEWKYRLFSVVPRHNYSSDFKLSLYVVTYYKVTSLYRIFFFLRNPCPIWHKRAITSLSKDKVPSVERPYAHFISYGNVNLSPIELIKTKRCLLRWHTWYFIFWKHEADAASFLFSSFTFRSAKKLKHFQKQYLPRILWSNKVFEYWKMVCSYLPMPKFD